MAILYVNTIAELTASAAVSGDTVIVGGYYAISDGGGGYFQCMSLPITTFGGTPVDRGLVFYHDDLDRWFQRIVDCPYISVKWFGAYGDNDHDDSDAINRAFNAALNHGTLPIICDSGNTFIDIPQASNVSATATRSRVYFPAGVYRISYPIAQLPNMQTYVAYPANCLEIIGEQSIIAPTDAFAVSDPFALFLDPINRVRISSMTFAGFENAVKFKGTNVAKVVLDNVGFTEIENIGIEVDCPYADFTLNYIKWYPVQYPLWQKHGNVHLVGGWMVGKPFLHDNDAMIIVEKGFLNVESLMGVPNEESQYFDSSAWIKNIGGSVRCENVRFGGENMVMHAVINEAKGQIYELQPNPNKAMPPAPICITFIDCYFAPFQAVKLLEIPNSIIFENNSQFLSWNPLVAWAGTGPLQDKLEEMTGHFSIKIDNVPFFRAIFSGGGMQANLADHTPYLLLPFVKLNNGLDSYGYIFDDDCEMPESHPLKFFMGKLSHDGSVFSGIYGDYSYEVHLTTVSNYESIQNHPETTGSINQYAAYRVEVHIDRSQPMFPKTKVETIKDITPGGVNLDPDAPMLTAHTQNSNLVLVNTRNNLDTNNPPKRKYGIFYEIRNLIPPMAVPFAGVS